MMGIKDELVLGRYTPMGHQLEDVERLSFHPRINVWNGLGSGKTCTAAWWLQTLWWRGAVDDVILVLPSMTAMDWEETFLDLAWPGGLADFVDARPPNQTVITEMMMSNRLGGRGCLHVYCTTYGGARSLFTEQSKSKGRWKVNEGSPLMSAIRGRRVAAVFDEAQAAALQTSAQGKACRALAAAASHVCSVTATPIGNPLSMRLWGLTTLVRPDILRRWPSPSSAQGAPPGSFTAFKCRYGHLQDPVQQKHIRAGRENARFIPGRAYPVAIHEDMIQREVLGPMAPLTTRRRKEDCLDIPPKVYFRRGCILPPKVQRMMRDLIEDDRAVLDTGRAIVIDNVLEERLRTVELTGGWLAGEPIHDCKLRLLQEVIQQFGEDQPNGQYIIWASRTRELLGCAMVAAGAKPADALMKASDVYPAGETTAVQHLYRDLVASFRRNGIGLLHGPTPQKDRDEIQRLFKAGRLRCVVAHPGVAGAGLNWQHAHAAMYYSQPLGTIARQQSEDRIHRHGLTHDAWYFDLVTEGGPDEAVLQAHRQQRDTAMALLDWMRDRSYL